MIKIAKKLSNLSNLLDQNGLTTLSQEVDSLLLHIYKTAHYIPDYTVVGSQEAQYDKGWSIILDLYRESDINGIEDMSDRVKRIKQNKN